MSIQDKIFDVESALEGKPEAKVFEELIEYIGKLESNLQYYQSAYVKTIEAIKLAVENNLLERLKK